MKTIRVWDIVEDHDNLTRCIGRAVERIEKSYIRGQECMLYSELDGVFGSIKNDPMANTNGSKLFAPRVFPMRLNVKGLNESISSLKKSSFRHYPPASDDERQFNLLKFYELNSSAIKLILESKDSDLPFTPGPKEHEIIHYEANPVRSLLLMGRSGNTNFIVFYLNEIYHKFMRSLNL